MVNGIPRHDTIARVITKLKADEIEQAFQSWMKTLVQTTGTDIIAVDGKTACHSFDTRERTNPLHSVNAWSCSNQLVLGQAAVADKSNEITAIPKLLALLDIENCIITIDAMGCQRKIAKQIVQSKADVENIQFFRPVVKGRISRSVTLLSMLMLPSSK